LPLWVPPEPLVLGEVEKGAIPTRSQLARLHAARKRAHDLAGHADERE
jgi:hypothetical protein